MKRLAKKKRYILFGVTILIAGFVAGFIFSRISSNQNEHVIVWAIEDTVKMPSGLQNYLESQHSNDCKGWRGTDTPTGVALFAVEKSVDDNYALMSYGCSNNLSPSIVAFKTKGQWQLAQPVDYYSGKTENDMNIPLCSALDKYQISKNAEPECVNAKGTFQANTND